MSDDTTAAPVEETKAPEEATPAPVATEPTPEVPPAEEAPKA